MNVVVDVCIANLCLCASFHQFCLSLSQNLPPVQTVGVGVCSTKNSLVAISFKKQVLIPLVLRGDYSAVRILMEQLKGKSKAAHAKKKKKIAKASCDVKKFCDKILLNFSWKKFTVYKLSY